MKNHKSAKDSIIFSDALDSLFIPNSLPLANSAWHGHVPFAHWLMAALQPACFVELGTHEGVSYAAFCESVRRFGLNTTCHAIDTWMGDPHAGIYGEDVYDRLCAFHNQRYASFSALHRQDFDSARSGFADGSIDLLHIDGFHTEAAVRHDFNVWKSALSPRGVVIFHDIAVREGDFGVWRLWDELSAQYPSFSLTHSYGLGLLALGPEIPDVIHDLCNLHPEAAARVRARFATLGAASAAPFSTQQRLHKVQVELNYEKTQNASAKTENETMAASLKRCHARNQKLDQDTSLLSERAAKAERHASVLVAQLQSIESELRAILNSRSWQVTAPLRKLILYTRSSKETYSRRSRLLINSLRGDRAAQQRIARAFYRRFGILEQNSTAPTVFAQDNLLEPIFSGSWLARFDTPSIEVLKCFVATSNTLPTIRFVLHFRSGTTRLAIRTRQSLEHVVGLNWSGVILLDPSCSSAEVAQVREVFISDKRFSFELPPDDGTPTLLLQAGALPRAHGPRVLIDALLAAPSAVIAYSDESKVDEMGAVFDPWFKPEYSPLLAEQGVLLGRMTALRTVKAVELADPALLVRRTALAAGAAGVVHVPHVLFHDAGPPITSLPLHSPPLSNPLPMVSVLIPTRNRWDLLKNCLASIDRSEWPRERLEIIVIDNGSDDPITLNELSALENRGHIRVLRDPRSFNYAQLNNEAARQARGDLLILLNNDTEVIDPQWIGKLASFALCEDVGAVGPKLLYPDRTVQHGGVVLGVQGVAVHAHVGLREKNGGYAGLANLTHEVSAVTGACIAVSREHYFAVGGLNELFRVSFNDIIFCLDLQKRGLSNIYLGEPILIHHESKSRGYDDTPEKQALARAEARNAWLHHADVLRFDPFYSPNLSLEKTYTLAFSPRRRSAWDHVLIRTPRIMILSCTHARGHGVPIVIKIQAEALVARGHQVIIGGPISENEIDYPNCERIEVHDPRIAAVIAAERSIDVIITHTPPFFSVARWVGDYPRVMAYDHGEPPPSIFQDYKARLAILHEKDQALVMCTRAFAISDAIASESRTPVNGIIPLGNAHLGRWDALQENRRERVRAMRGWEDRFVILNVCRFHLAERTYKGVDTFIRVRQELEISAPDLARRAIFVLCGKGDPNDVAAMTAQGLEVAANVSDEELVNLYCAADAYTNFSTWEGYNLGIGQALAMGLPVVASDIPAHRAFGIDVTNQAGEAAMFLLKFSKGYDRIPRIFDWSGPLKKFAAEVENLCPSDRINAIKNITQDFNG